MSGMDWSGMESLSEDARFRRSVQRAVEEVDARSASTEKRRRVMVAVKIVKDANGVPLLAYGERL